MPTLFIAPPKDGDFLEVGELVSVHGDEALASYDSSAPGNGLMIEAKDDRRAVHYRFSIEDDEGNQLDFLGKVFSRKRNPATGNWESQIRSDDPIF